MKSPLKFRRATEAFTLLSSNSTLELYKMFLGTAKLATGNIFYYTLKNNATATSKVLHDSTDFTGVSKCSRLFSEFNDVEEYSEGQQVPAGTKIAILFDDDYHYKPFTAASNVSIVWYNDREDTWNYSNAVYIREIKTLVEALIKLRNKDGLIDISEQLGEDKPTVKRISYTPSDYRTQYVSPELVIYLYDKRDNWKDAFSRACVTVDLDDIPAFDAYNYLRDKICEKVHFLYYPDLSND